MKKYRRLGYLLTIIIMISFGNISIPAQMDLSPSSILAGSSVFVFKSPRKFFSKPAPARKPRPVRPAVATRKVREPAIPEVFAPEDWINEQADLAIEERKVSDSEPFLSLSNGFLNSRVYFCETPQFPDSMRKAKSKTANAKVLVTVGQYGGILQATTVEGDAAFRSEVYRTLGSMNFRKSAFMGKPIRIEGMLNFTQDPANKGLCKDTIKELVVPAVIDGGVLNEMAVGLEVPQFPADAAGEVVEARIQVIIDEQGKVINATVLDGHKSFGEAAIMASKNVTFPRSVIAGTPVKVQGILEFKKSRSDKALIDSPISYARYLM